ncbi:DUF397 domain-containing protein [Nocardia australiensis]|uniref:DUF397 domain-containing protein n=1 Tax=Nocardia australiensis TaxID=2887191 RepID=UPI001D14C023|nr:DUF397 domain-containing protein [Nocardia australiensis]
MTTYGTVTWRKARRSGQGGACVEVAVWKKAARSGQNGNCVEVKADGTAILIRDSKYLRDSNNNPELQPIIAITTTQWHTFLDVVAGRSSDTVEPRVTVHLDGSATLTGANGIALDYTPAEWEAFSLGVIDGEFDDLAEGWQPAAADLVTA